LEALQEEKTIAASLEPLNFVDQGDSKFTKGCKALSKSRKGLVIKEGRTDGDGYAAQYVSSMTGGESITTWFGGKQVNPNATYPNPWEMPLTEKDREDDYLRRMESKTPKGMYYDDLYETYMPIGWDG
jgi:hypothetical protein